jgi:protein-disulfide isomerase
MRLNRRSILGAAAIGLGLGTAARLAAQPGPPTRRVAPEARAAATSDPVLPPEGNPRGDVTVLELLDYNCPFCRRMAPELDALVRSDPKVRVLYTPWPIFGAGSAYAAQAVVAADRQGKALAAHHALIGAGRRLSGPETVDPLLEAAGVDLSMLKGDLKAQAVPIALRLARSARIANLLGAQGTPMLLIGTQSIAGALDRRGLERFVAQARAA